MHDCIKEREEHEEKYEQVPQNLCKWCSFYKGNGGPCEVEIPKWEPKYKKKKESYADVDASFKGQIELDAQKQFPDYD